MHLWLYVAHRLQQASQSLLLVRAEIPIQLRYPVLRILLDLVLHVAFGTQYLGKKQQDDR